MKKIINVLHHSHTDIGYTETQNKIIKMQVDNLKVMIKEYQKNPQAFKNWKWICESFYIVEKFLAQANADELKLFQEMSAQKIISFSGSYLNLSELASSILYQSILQKSKKIAIDHHFQLESAMCNDVNGFSLGYAQALSKYQINNLYFGLHSHHGMYPAFKKQAPFWWEVKPGQKILVWVGEHYMMGNEFALIDQPLGNYVLQSNFTSKYFAEEKQLIEAKKRIIAYLDSLAKTGYQFQNVPMAVAGAQTDNAPFNLNIAKRIDQLNQLLVNDDIEFKMVSLDEFFNNIKAENKDIPTYQGDWPDWWTDGTASTPKATRIFKAAQRKYQLIKKLDLDNQKIDQLEENLILYAEHTWGAYSSIENPFQFWNDHMQAIKAGFATTALNLSSEILDEYLNQKEFKHLDQKEIKIKILNPFAGKAPILVNLNQFLSNNEVNKINDCGFKAVNNNLELPIYTIKTVYMNYPIINHYFLITNLQKEQEIIIKILNQPQTIMTSQTSTLGADLIDDVYNPLNNQEVVIHNQVFENDFIKIAWNEKGIYSLFAKNHQQELLTKNNHGLFSPLYQASKIPDAYVAQGQVRKGAGRSHKQSNFDLDIGKITYTNVPYESKEFCIIEFYYQVKGTKYFKLTLEIVNQSLTIKAKVQLIKTPSWSIENFYLNFPLNITNKKVMFDKKPAIEIWKDQIPGSLIDYFSIQDGFYLTSDKQKPIIISVKDHSLFWTGPVTVQKRFLAHDQRNQDKPQLLAWPLNNAWETNFNVDLSGFHEFNYQIYLPEQEVNIDHELQNLNGNILCKRII